MANSAVCRHTRMLPVEWELVVRRLRLAGPFSRYAPLHDAPLVQAAGGVEWRLALVLSLQAMAAMLPGKLGSLPSAVADPGAWELLRQSFRFE